MAEARSPLWGGYTATPGMRQDRVLLRCNSPERPQRHPCGGPKRSATFVCFSEDQDPLCRRVLPPRGKGP